MPASCRVKVSISSSVSSRLASAAMRSTSWRVRTSGMPDASIRVGAARRMAGARTEGPTRPAAFAGSWYPRDETALAAAVDRYLTPAAVPFSDVLAVISPHAGLMYSGPVAGRGYATVWEASGTVGGFEVAVLVGP